MKKALCLMLVLSWVFLPAPAFAKAEEKDDESKKIAEMLKQIDEKKSQINGSEWQITLQPLGGVKSSIDLTDTLTFQNGQFFSKSFSAKGFQPTNYTLTVKEEAPTVWETMQTSQTKKEGVAFWRGEWIEEVITGVVVRQIPEKPNEEYYFKTTSKKKIPPTSKGEEAGAAETAAKSAPATLDSTTGGKTKTTQTEKTKKKSFIW